MALEGGDIQAMQQFTGQSRWQDEKLLQMHGQLADETPGENDGVYIVDESGFLKKGEHSVGVAVRDQLPGPDLWIVFRRSLGKEPELKVYLGNAPLDTPLTELVRVAGLRWPVETAIGEGKDGLGMDHHELYS